MRLLILGGTTQAGELAAALAQMAGINATLSLAGRTLAPAASPLPVRVGGFGGAKGLADYLRAVRVHAVIDATHPFAAQISANAVAACAAACIPLAVFSRAAWEPQAGDRWTPVAEAAGAVVALGDAPRRVFLTVGRLALAAFALAPQHFYLVRTIDPVELAPLLPHHKLIRARGPFCLAEETALLRDGRIDALVTKNSGGAATQAKLAAARLLGIAVIMLARPQAVGAVQVTTLGEALAWIAHQRPAP